MGIEEKYKEAHRALHILWTKAVGTPGYNKKEWKDLDNALWEMRREARAQLDFENEERNKELLRAEQLNAVLHAPQKVVEPLVKDFRKNRDG